ncbi:oligosaccharide flippase family protein [Paenibacillus sp. NRS-1760]|uniref:oligosaccharide flippase family protein n=1 Tax=Paenibacillus sp. NRS-1760 TaxID=3233902 RepID=UPI003D29FFAD
MLKNVKVMQIATLFFSSIVGILLNIIIGFIIPQTVTVEDYSSYRIYMFYIGFLPILHLGIADGLLLKFSKYKVEELRGINFKGLLFKFFCFQIIITVFFILISLSIGNINIYYLAIILSIPLVNISGYMAQILILCGKYKIISFSNLIIKLITVLALGIMIILDYKDYRILILAMMLAYSIQIIIGYFSTKDDIFKTGNNREKIDVKQLIKIGFPIVLAYFISTLILGTDRMFIERSNNTYEYAMFSFAYSLITIFLTVLNSVNVVVFPTIMKMSIESRLGYYNYSRGILDVMLGISSICIILFSPIINLVIPKYSDSLQYFYLLFPVVFLRIHYSLRLWPHMNSLGKSKTVLIVNTVILLVSFLLNLIVFYLNLDFSYYAITTIISLYLMNVILESIIRKHENITKDFKLLYQFIIISLMLVTYINFDYTKYILFIIINLILTIWIYFKDTKNIINQFRKVKGSSF